MFTCKCQELFILNLFSVDIEHYVGTTDGYFLLFFYFPEKVVENAKVKPRSEGKRYVNECIVDLTFVMYLIQ